MSAIELVSIGISIVIGLVTLFTVIKKSGNNDGELHTTLKNMAGKVDEIKDDLSGMKNDITDIKIRNAAKDADDKRNNECIQDIKNKVEKHDGDISNLKSVVDFIDKKLVVVPKQ